LGGGGGGGGWGVQTVGGRYVQANVLHTG